MKGKIIDIGIYEDQYYNRNYRVVVEFKEEPPFKLGEAELKQEEK